MNEPFNYKRKRAAIGFFIGLLTFVCAVFISKGLLYFVPNSFVWTEQVLLKGVLIALSMFGIHYFLKISFTAAGFRKPTSKIKKRKVIFSGMFIGALATVLIFFTPAKGIALIKQLNPIEFVLIIVLWSSIAEEVLVRGLVQSYLKPIENKKVGKGRFQLSIPVISSAVVFSTMHLSLLFTHTDYYTVLLVVITTFLLGILAGIYREKYNSIIPSILTHISFNIGGLVSGVAIAILYRIVTGNFPTH